MENFMVWIVALFAAITVYRLLSRRALSPKARVAAMLRRYRALERTGLSEQECLLQLLATRRDWKGLPHRFLAELVSRFRSKEDLMRFVSVSEDYGYYRDQYPKIATRIDLEAAMAEVACLFARSASGCKRKNVIERRSSCRSWHYDYNPISTLPISLWRLPITKRAGMTMHFHCSNKASLDSKTLKRISTLSNRHFLRKSV